MATAQASRRLAAIMFTDLVGYSALAHRDEALAIELLQLHRGWVRDILPRHGGIEIETVGDAFLIEFGGALSAVECAVAIQRRFAEYNASVDEGRRMELRVGIHVGDIEHTDGKVMGDGVNIASRIHGFAAPGAICVSEDVHHAVRNRSGFDFRSLGTPALKNIETPLELYQLSIAAARPATRGRAVPSKAVWLAAGVAVIAIAIAGLSGAWLASRGQSDRPPAIAVLPFENLSAEADSAYFTDGLHDTVIGHLSRVSGLKVISRTSVMGYRGKQANLRKIAGELGADHILEGSVQRAGGRLRVAAQLIDTATDTHLWSTEYDRDLADVFAVQADIARSVASAVHARLSPQEAAGIAAVPTTDQAAYDLYLRAVQVERSGNLDGDKIREAIDWLNQAVTIDPAFARAHALLAHLHDNLNWFGHDPTDARRRLVGEHAERALALEPNLPEAHVAKALHLYHGSRSYDAALAELEAARGIAPGNASVHYWLATIYRRQARWTEALSSQERASALDPLNPSFLTDLGGTLRMLRRYRESEQILARVVRVEPENPFAPMNVAYSRYLQEGDLAVIKEALARLPAGLDPDCQVSFWRMGVAMVERHYDEALAAIVACRQSHLSIGQAQLPKAYYVAQVRWLRDDRRRPPPEAAAVRAELERMLAAGNKVPGVRMALAMTLAMLAERSRAVEEAEAALAAMPLSRDALTGTQNLREAVEVFANAGAEQRALDLLEQALRLPGGPHVQELRLDPLYDPLRAHPRFVRLLAEQGTTASR